MSSTLITPVTNEQIVEALANFPSSGRAPADEATYNVWLHLEASGLIESKTTETPCRTCGRRRVTGSWHSITPAGRIVLEIAGKTA